MNITYFAYVQALASDEDFDARIEELRPDDELGDADDVDDWDDIS